jgi:sugar lactone lactonase YvrE
VGSPGDAPARDERSGGEDHGRGGQYGGAAAVALVTVVETLLPFLGPTGMAVESSGTLVVVDNDLQAVVRVDPQTGARTIVSDATTGSGTPLRIPDSIAVEATGMLVVVSLSGSGSETDAVMRVDPQTGARTIVSDATTGSGPPFGPLALQGIAVAPTGDLVVIDATHDTVVRVDAITGDRTVISSSAVIGSGPALFSESIAAGATGPLFVAGRGFLFQVDPHTGMRRVVTNQLFDSFSEIAVEASGTVIGVWEIFIDVPCRRVLTRVDPATGLHHSFGPACPITVAVESTGSLVASFQGDPRHTFRPNMLVRLDPSTGNGTPIVTSHGPALQFIRSIAVESTGTFVVVDSGLNAVVRINEQTGEQTIVSDATTGSGPPFQQLGNIAVEATGDLVTMDHGRVLRINPVTGDRTIVSAASTGSGPAFFVPSAIAVEPTGTLVGTVPGFRAVVRVDPLSGDRAVISR